MADEMPTLVGEMHFPLLSAGRQTEVINLH